jgi:hypothetical protein
MSNPTCTTASLNVACFRGYKLTRLQKLAYKIWFASNELSVIGGTNYTSLLTKGSGSLLNAAVQQFGHWDRDALDSAELAIYYNNAVNAGAEISNNPNVIQTFVRRLEQVNEDDLMKMLVVLECQLGRHKSYPQ